MVAELPIPVLFTPPVEMMTGYSLPCCASVGTSRLIVAERFIVGVSMFSNWSTRSAARNQSLERSKQLPALRREAVRKCSCVIATESKVSLVLDVEHSRSLFLPVWNCGSMCHLKSFRVCSPNGRGRTLQRPPPSMHFADVHLLDSC